MTAWVLVLAGVTAGDGGMRPGAAAEPVRAAPRLDVKWEGGGWVGGSPVAVWLDGGRLFWGDGSFNVSYPCPPFRPDGRVGSGGWRYELAGGRLTIRGADFRLVLRPADRKP